MFFSFRKKLKEFFLLKIEKNKKKGKPKIFFSFENIKKKDHKNT